MKINRDSSGMLDNYSENLFTGGTAGLTRRVGPKANI